MALKTYSGSCHCGAVKFQADIDISKGTNRCNCSLCTKARTWMVIVRPPHFKQLAGADAQTTYQWTPPGRPHPVLEYYFCKTCGIRAFGRGEHESLGGVWYFVSIAALDDVDADELAAAPINYVDGRHDRFNERPADIRLM